MKLEELNLVNQIFVNISYLFNRRTTSHWHMKEDFLPCHNIMFVYAGTGTFVRNGTACSVQKGDFIYYKKGDRRELYTNPDNLLLLYALNFDYILIEKWQENMDPLIQKSGLPIPFVTNIKNPRMFKKIDSLFHKMCNIYASKSHLAPLKCRCILSEILYLIFCYNSADPASYDIHKKVDDVIRYLGQNYARDITLQELANTQDISVSYLGKIFRAVTNTTPIDYLIQIRINQAKQMLREDFSIAETAALTGFYDTYHFSKTFKMREGISPSEFKILYRPLLITN